MNVLEMNPDVVVTITTISLTFVALKMIVEEAVLLPHGSPVYIAALPVLRPQAAACVMHALYVRLSTRPSCHPVRGWYYKVTTTPLHQDVITPQTASTCLTSRSPEGLLGRAPCFQSSRKSSAPQESKGKIAASVVVSSAGRGPRYADTFHKASSAPQLVFFVCLSHVLELDFSNYMPVSPKDMHIDVGTEREPVSRRDTNCLCAACTT